MRHLVSWAHLVGCRIVIVDDGGRAGWPVVREPGEVWDDFEARRLTTTLRGLREGGLPWRSQVEVARLAGVSRKSITRWESGQGLPRMVGLIGWTLALGCRVAPVPSAKVQLIAVAEGCGGGFGRRAASPRS